MKVMTLSKVKAKFSRLVREIESRKQEIIITRQGKPVAVIIGMKKYDGLYETVEISGDAELMKEIQAGIRALRRTHTRVTIDQLFDAEGKK